MFLKTVAFGLSFLALTACVSVLPEPTAPDALYRIEAKSSHAGLQHNLIVREPEAPRLIGGQGMVSKGEDGGLRMVPGVEWSGPATRQIQLAMIDSFKSGEPGNALLPELGVLTDYELASELSVLRLEGETAICKMKVSLIATRDRSLLARSEVQSEQSATSRNASDRANALRAAASECAAQATAFAIATLPSTS
ncbi:MAG: ABC-type transport auxiliary lipoprotein family protein [Henriciella sp.]|nr:ABC-type transport auxiliary lipoprotein family protein [Hyphomonadaceae bacterium]